jgi:cytidylate kinase
VSDTARVIAVDGPAGAGKTSACRGLAGRLGFAHVDTGAMYRLVGLVAHDRGVSLDDAAALEQLVDSLRLSVGPEGLVGPDLPDPTRIRGAAAGEYASRASTHPGVRRRLVELQRRVGAVGDVVMEGRDIGTVVFPDAALKVFLTADPAERARRRSEELAARGEEVDVEALTRELARRDERDRSRRDSPLRPAEGARTLDTTGLTLPEVVDLLTVWALEALEDSGRP